MSRNESRKERKQQENKPEIESRTETRSGISKVYYYIIGFLFLVLFLLIIFIFTRNGNDIKLNDEATDESALVENDNQENSNTSEDNAEEETSPEKESDESGAEKEESTEEKTEEKTNEEDKKADELEPGESTVVNEDAPHDANHATDYNDGSTDRVAIKNEIMAATGLKEDLIEWWIGNDGAGRVEATVSNREQTEIYQVHLQYGDGNWHVLDYERINEVPNN